jgi:paraquat-inducible protein A
VTTDSNERDPNETVTGQIACHACDVVHRLPPMPAKATVNCVRCGAVIFRTKLDTIDRTIAWTLAAMILFAVAISFPFLGLKTGGIDHHTGLLTGIWEMFNQGLVAVALLVLMTCILVPLIQLLALLYVLVPMKFGWRTRFASQVFRLQTRSRPWSMMGVFMLGVVVALVKLHEMATILPGLAVYAFGALIFAMAFAISSLDTHYVWARIDELADG